MEIPNLETELGQITCARIARIISHNDVKIVTTTELYPGQISIFLTDGTYESISFSDPNELGSSLRSLQSKYSPQLVAFLLSQPKTLSLIFYEEEEPYVKGINSPLGFHEFSIRNNQYIVVWGKSWSEVDRITRELEYRRWSIPLERTKEEWIEWLNLRRNHTGVGDDL